MGWDAGCLGLQWAARLEELKKRDFWQETSAENTGTDKTVSKTALPISIPYSPDFPTFYPVSFFPREYEIRMVYAAYSAGRYGIFPSRFRLLQSQLLLLLRCCSPNAISRPPLYLVSISLCIDRMGL